MRARSTSITRWYSSRTSRSFWATRSAADCAAFQSRTSIAEVNSPMSLFICETICGGMPLVSAAVHA